MKAGVADPNKARDMDPSDEDQQNIIEITTQEPFVTEMGTTTEEIQVDPLN